MLNCRSSEFSKALSLFFSYKNTMYKVDHLIKHPEKSVLLRAKLLDCYAVSEHHRWALHC